MGWRFYDYPGLQPKQQLRKHMQHSVYIFSDSIFYLHVIHFQKKYFNPTLIPFSTRIYVLWKDNPVHTLFFCTAITSSLESIQDSNFKLGIRLKYNFDHCSDQKCILNNWFGLLICTLISKKRSWKIKVCFKP